MDGEKIPVNRTQTKPVDDTIDLNEPDQQVEPDFKAPEPAPKKAKSGKGKKVLLVILGLVVLAGAAYGAYWYGQEQVKKENEAKINDLQAQIDATKSEAKGGASESKNTETGYLAIKQWDAKVKTDDGTTIYEITKIDPSGEALYLNTSTTKSVAVKCKGQEDGAGLVAVYRYPKKLSSLELGNLEFIKQIDENYYYLWVAPDCTAASAEEVSTAINELKPVAISITKAE